MTSTDDTLGSSASARARAWPVPAIEATGVSKIYGPTVALADARLRVEPGTIHGLLGENGAGKSTLVRILAGVERADGGRVQVLGEDPQSGTNRARAFIHQDLGLFPTMSVASNMALGNQFERRFGLISDNQTERRAAETLARLEMRIDPRSLVGELTLADQTAVAIARALHSGVELIVLDEPTAYLDADQVRGVMRILTRLRSESVACLLITHRANDVLETCDEVTVLRDGETVAARPVTGLTPNELVRIISGHEPTTSTRSTARTERRPVLEVSGLRAASTEPVSFEVGEGEVVALCGLADAGTRTVARALFGVEPATSGVVAVDGVAVTIDSPASAIRAGIASVPLDRRREGLAADLSVRENLFMKPEGKRWMPIRIRGERVGARDLMQRFLAVPVEPERPMSTFSGGNQQKAVIAKWWNKQPKLLILNEPTAGVDLAAKADIHALLRRYSEEHGLAVLLVSSDFGEIADVADRVYVMRHGRIIKHVESAECDARQLVALAYGEELG